MLLPITACAALAVGCGLATRDPDTSLGASGGAQSSAGGAPSNGASAGDAQGAASASGGRASELRGSFQLAAFAQLTLMGLAARGPVPGGIAHRTVMEEGGCRLLVPDDACSERCEAGVLCNRDGECASDEALFDVGPIRVSGLPNGDQVVNTLPDQPRYWSAVDEASCDEGAPLRLESSVFGLATPCIGPVTTWGHPLVSFRAGEPATVTWNPPRFPGISRIEIFFQLSKDNDPPFDIQCHARDTGIFVVPASLVTRAFELGISYFPDVEIMRASVPDTSQPAGFVFEMRSWNERSLDTGVPYCNQDADCPQGLVCGPRTEFTCEAP